jgi:hypothetical protein
MRPYLANPQQHRVTMLTLNNTMLPCTPVTNTVLVTYTYQDSVCVGDALDPPV